MEEAKSLSTKGYPVVVVCGRGRAGSAASTADEKAGHLAAYADTFSGMNHSDIAQLLSSAEPELRDPSTLTTPELLAQAAAIHSRLQRLYLAKLHLLESLPDSVAEHPELQEELAYLRTLGLEEVSGPGS